MSFFFRCNRKKESKLISPAASMIPMRGEQLYTSIMYACMVMGSKLKRGGGRKKKLRRNQEERQRY